MEQQINQKINELQNGIGQMIEKKDTKMNEENVTLKDKNAQLEEEICQLKEKMAKMVEENNKIGQKRKMLDGQLNSKRPKSSIFLRGLPTELINELFGSLPFENAFALLAKMPNGLLARNVQKMVKSIKMTMKNNKWNMEDCGPLLAISEDKLTVEYSGIDHDFNSVRAIFPISSFKLAINKPTILFYFEVKILKQDVMISIGFCCHNFELEYQQLGFKSDNEHNSIGIIFKDRISINGSNIVFANKGCFFNEGDIIGLGIIDYPANLSMKCFVTCNGKLLGKINLPPNFANVQFFPAITMTDDNELIQANFGKEEWCFKKFSKVLE